MNPVAPTPPQPARPDRLKSWLGLVAFLGGVATAMLITRAVPPAPIYSSHLGRATYWQSYETSYFASLQAYEKPIRDLLAQGLVPVVVFGDSTIRGTGATDEGIWTRELEKQLHAVNPRVRVLNYAQNAGDLMGPFLYHYLQKRFPQARYIVQWHFSSEVGMRHQFHFWLTSEIALRDGQRNPAVTRSFNLVRVTRPDERGFAGWDGPFSTGTARSRSSLWRPRRTPRPSWRNLSRRTTRRPRLCRLIFSTTSRRAPSMCGRTGRHMRLISRRFSPLRCAVACSC
jgi:hypothetical protein